MEAFPTNFADAPLARVSDGIYMGFSAVGGSRERLGPSVFELQILAKAVDSAEKADWDTYEHEAAGIEVGYEIDPGMLGKFSAVGVGGLEDPLTRFP